VLFGLITFLYGTAIAKALSFPVLYLLLMVPPPLGILDNITLPMRKGVSILTEMILKLLNYPVTREGLLLFVGKHQIFMGQPCSGLRSLITMISLGLAYTYIIKGSWAKKLFLLAAVIPLTLAGNLIRVVAVCIATYYLGETKGQKIFHDFSGFAIFIIVILGLIALEHLWERLNKKRKNEV